MNQKEYNEGILAYKNGKDLTDNPYSIKFEYRKYRAWEFAYESQYIDYLDDVKKQR